MEERYPFGEAFGPARSRDQVISSAHSVYQRLINFSDDNILSLDILYLLAENEDGVTNDRMKKKALRKFFRPDAQNHVPMLTFVQACDSLYKRMRFFRASVGNASVIEAALENIVDGFYNFFLILLILCILRMNPWPLLVSFSSLILSFSFAVSSSASKYIEGMLLVAARRWVVYSFDRARLFLYVCVSHFSLVCCVIDPSIWATVCTCRIPTSRKQKALEVHGSSKVG